MLSACAIEGATRPIGARVINAGEGIQTLQPVEFDVGKGSLLLTSMVFDNRGRLAICANAILMGEVDLSRQVHEALEAEGSVLSLVSKAGGVEISVPAKFLSLRYQPMSIGERVTLSGDSNGAPVDCIGVNHAWRPEFKSTVPKLSLAQRGR